MPSLVSTSIGPPVQPYTSMNDYDGSGNLTYSGVARSAQNSFTYTVSSYSKANPGVVTTSAAHGLQTGQAVTIAGATGSWAGVNGTQNIIVLSSTTFSIAIDTSAYSGTFDGTISTTAPRTNSNVWAISLNYYDGSNRLTRSTWACVSPSTGGTSADALAWDSRTTYAYA